MVNLIEEVCLLENWNHNISMNDKNLELQPMQLLLQDPYDSVWLKIIAIFSYYIGFVSSAIMVAFIFYENGHHGNFRTVINQLLSNLYATVRYKSPLKKLQTCVKMSLFVHTGIPRFMLLMWGHL